jgi:uncharacterized protein YbjQ (UPF0145 family)
MVIAGKDHAQARMEQAARVLGANAVVGSRFEAENIGSGRSQNAALLAYGTAVRVTASSLRCRTAMLWLQRHHDVAAGT